MISDESHNWTRRFGSELDDARYAFPTVRSPIDVIAQKDRHGMVKRPSFDIRLDALSDIPKEVVTAMDVTNAVNQSSIRHATRRRNRRQFLKDPKERIRPPREFTSPYALDWVVHLTD